MDEKATSLYASILITSIVLGSIIIYFIISIIRQQRRTVDLYKQSLFTEITTLEKERSRMAADLHDEIGPVLSAIKLRVASLDIHSKDDQEEVEKTYRQIDTLIKRVREISFDLMPPSLLLKGLPSALKEFIEYCGKSSLLCIKFQFTEVELTEKQAINLYRIIQEIIHNTMKHAGATELLIELRKEKNRCILAAKDNGKGFNYEARSKEAAGLGLQNLLRRSEIIDGKMFFESKKGKGTTYIFEIPIAADEINNDN